MGGGDYIEAVSVTKYANVNLRLKLFLRTILGLSSCSAAKIVLTIDRCFDRHPYFVMPTDSSGLRPALCKLLSATK